MNYITGHHGYLYLPCAARDYEVIEPDSTVTAGIGTIVFLLPDIHHFRTVGDAAYSHGFTTLSVGYMQASSSFPGAPIWLRDFRLQSREAWDLM